jgi:hypothetical protein
MRTGITMVRLKVVCVYLLASCRIPDMTRAKALPPAKPPTRWGQERRLEFIDFRLRWEGRLNRGDLMAFFGISVPQASLDIARYLETAPANLTYDRSARVYVATDAFKPLYSSSSPSRYLSELLAFEAGILQPEASFVGWRPPSAHVPAPGRTMNAGVLFALLRAIRERSAVRLLYQSFQRPDPTARTLSPHAFAHDGFRWHVRAYCHMRHEFRDFVIARMLKVESSDETWHGPEDDHEWHAHVELVLAPNPKLSKPHQRVVELDYGMTGGTVGLACRQALVFYVLRHLGLDEERASDPKAQQVVLKNRRLVQKHLKAAEPA